MKFIALSMISLFFANLAYAEPVTLCEVIAIEHQGLQLLAFRTRTIIANTASTWRESEALAETRNRTEGLTHWPYQHNRGMQHLRELKQRHGCDLDSSKIRCEFLNGQQQESLRLVNPQSNQDIYEFNRSGGVTYEQMINDFRSEDLCH